MWQEENMENDVADKKVERDSGNVDSGFLSSGNLILYSEELSSENIPEEEAPEQQQPRKTPPVAQEPMRVDSGLDIGLSESLSQLTLSKQKLNPLASGKVQSEPTFELHPFTQSKIKDEEVQEAPRETTATLEPWQIYYAQDEEGDTQLHIAIVRGFLEAAFSLIRMAPNPVLLDILNDDGQAPLHLAVMTEQHRIVRRLVLAGANPAQRNTRGNTALHLACYIGNLNCAKALTDPLTGLERSYLLPRRVPALPQNLEQRNYDGEMCLHIAAAGDKVELVRLLLRLGADLEAREALSGKTALHLAVERGCRSVILFLLTECQPSLDAPTYAGITAYQIAACLDEQLAMELVRKGATPLPLPESDSDVSDDDSSSDESIDPAFLSQTLNRPRQNPIGVRV